MSDRRDQLGTDERLERLLDAALAPEAPSAALMGRILAATEPRLGRRRGVVARIGPSALAMAASVAAAGLVAVWAGLVADRAEVRQPLVVDAERWALVGERLEALDALAASAGGSAAIDQEITLVALQVDLVDLSEPWAAQEGLEDALLRAELDALSLGDPMGVF